MKKQKAAVVRTKNGRKVKLPKKEPTWVHGTNSNCFILLHRKNAFLHGGPVPYFVQVDAKKIKPTLANGKRLLLGVSPGSHEIKLSMKGAMKNMDKKVQTDALQDGELEVIEVEITGVAIPSTTVTKQGVSRSPYQNPKAHKGSTVITTTTATITETVTTIPHKSPQQGSGQSSSGSVPTQNPFQGRQADSNGDASQPPYPQQQQQQTPYPQQQPQQAPYPSQQAPYPSQQAPYPQQQYSPQQQQYSPQHQQQQTPYPSQQAPYPSQPAPYPSQQAPYPSQQAPYPSQQAPYPQGPYTQPPYPTQPYPQQQQYPQQWGQPPQQVPYGVGDSPMVANLVPPYGGYLQPYPSQGGGGGSGIHSPYPSQGYPQPPTSPAPSGSGSHSPYPSQGYPQPPTNPAPS
eukprot:CAMPEP_0174255288 /NCGR_PEP_ID=MMETSP0439-20130205/4638_1 /TAXON_ID=0 /ORGANISM="Stereomyxa ramosa, Strain Chinc5" /LENGTH=400 /DNA_ID=CAMNT_0015337411 /DNA_START=14 /DNA_END=1216 /DNA_ORIENTATION=-